MGWGWGWCCCGDCVTGNFSAIYITQNITGGTLAHEKYDLTLNTWAPRTAPISPTAYLGARGAQACIIKATFVTGQIAGSQVPYHASYVEDLWTQHTSPSAPFLGGQIEVAFENGRYIECFNTVAPSAKDNQRYKVLTDQWSTWNGYPIYQAYCTYGNILDTIYFAGGFTSHGLAVTTHYAYMSQTDVYLSALDLPMIMTGAASMTFKAQHAYNVACGAAVAPYRHNLQYNTAAWYTKTQAPGGHSQGQSIGGAPGGFAMGGFDAGTGPQLVNPGHTDEYNPVLDSWATMTYMLGPREEGATGAI